MRFTQVHVRSWRVAAVTLMTAGALLAASTPKTKTTHSMKAAAVAAPAPQASAQAGADSGINAFRPSNMQASIQGTPGIWNTQFAETLLPGQVSAGVYLDRFERDPGGMVFTNLHVGGAIGLTRNLELSVDATPYRRLRMTHPEELSFASTGAFTSYNPVAPFVRNPLVTGPVDYGVGLTIGLLSQERGNAIGLALQVAAHFPFDQDYAAGVNQNGVSTTEPRLNENLLIDKWMGNAGELAFNFGYQNNGFPDPGQHYGPLLQDQWNYGLGWIFPLLTHVQGALEFYGNKPFGAGVNPGPYEVSPENLNAGLRINPTPNLGLNLAYRVSMNSQSSIGRYTIPDGFVFGVSYGPRAPAPAPPPPPPTPTLACQVSASPVLQGTVVHISSTVSPETEQYTYSWTTTGGSLQPSGSTATLDTANLAPGMYTITGRVDNGQGGVASCNTQVEVREPVRHPPVASCSVEPSTPVLPGTALTFSVQASSPDHRPLTYDWEITPTTVGHLDATDQATVHLDTTGAHAGPVHATAKVTDDRGLSTVCSADGTIAAPPPPPEAALASTLEFRPNSSRVNNASKAALDDVALRLQQDANATAVIVGSATPNEVARRHLSPAVTERLAKERAENVETYLVKEKGISADRIQLRWAGDNAHSAQVWVVPQGASYTGTGQPFTPAGR